MRRLLALGMALAVVLAACGSSSALKGTSGKQLPDINIGADQLTEVKSGGVSLPYNAKADPGKLLVLYLCYTNCPDICPTTMSDIRTARQSLSASQQAKVDATFVTVDLANDTADVILDYTNRFSFGPHDHGVRPTPNQLDTAQKTLFATSADGGKAASGINIVNHTAYTYVVNSDGRVVDEWDYGTPAKDMAHDLKALLTKA